MILQVVYLASPYSHEDSVVRQHRFEEVCKLHAELLRQYGETTTFIGPIAMSHPVSTLGGLSDTSWNFWAEHDKALINKCDELWVIKMDGWERSTGVSAEIAYARELLIPISYVDPKDYHEP